jgi:hypothetical protein
MSDVTDFFGGLTVPQTDVPADAPAAGADTVADFFGGLTQPGNVFVPQTPATEEEDAEVTGVTETAQERDLRLRREAEQALTEVQQQQAREDAFSRLRVLLDRVGLVGLETNIRGLIARGVTDGDAVLFELRDTTEYRQRFAANEARTKKGLPALDPATYVALEEQYRTTLRSNGLPEGFYDQAEDFQKLIEGDVSNAELQSRIQQGYRLVTDADPEVKRQMQSLYGVDEQQLAAYFIDPERSTPILTKQAQAARIAARAREQGNMQLAANTVEDLVARGYSYDEAQTAFERAGQLSGLYQEMAGEEALTQQQKVGAIFGFDTEAARTIEQRQRQRIGEFQAGGQFARTSGATSGTVETGVGTAQ